MKQCTNPPSTTDGAAGSRGARADSRAKVAPNTMTAATSTTTTAASTATPASTSVSTSSNTGTVSSRSSSARESKCEPRPASGKPGTTSEKVHPAKPSKHHASYPPHPYPLHHHLQHHHQLSGKVNGKLGTTGVDHLSALNLLPAHLRDMFLAAHLLRGYYQPVGPLISPLHLAQPPTSQHGPGLSGLLGKSGPDGGSPLPGPPQPPPSSTADSTDSDVLLTGTPGRPSVPTDGMTMAFHPYRPAPAAATVAAAAAAADADRCFRSIFAGGDLLPRSSQHQQQQQAAYGAARYGPAPGGPPANLYGRPMQMHCPPAYLPQSYYAPSPYGQPPPPHPPPPPPEMYYTHAYPAAHYYPKFAAPQYYPTASRRYYPGPAPGPEHLYEQAPPGGAPVPQPPPPPASAQLVPAGPPQGPQHLDHYPYPAYPGYGSPGPGSGGQCYPRNLPHPPPFMDTHYSANCPCPMQCPKNVNAGSLIGIKASKGPVANKNNNTHIVQSQTSMSTEPITISSSSSSASSSASPAPAPLDIHTPITMASESASSDPSSQPGIHGHGYHHHGGHHGVQHHHHPSHQYHQHHQHQYPRQPALSEPASTAGLASSTVAPSVVTVTTTHPATPPRVVTTATSADHHYHHHHLHQPSQPHHPAKMCYKTEQLIKPESSAELLSTPMHYGNPYHHHYHHAAMGYYHHPKLAELKEEPPSHGGDLGGKLGGAPLPPYSIASKMALLETPELPASPARGSTGLSVPPMLGEAMQPPLIPRDGEKKGLIEEKVGEEEKLNHQDKKTISPNAVVKQEIEEFKLDLGLVSGGALCKKEDFEETGPAMTPDLLDESIVIKKDRDEEKPPTSRVVDATYHQQQQLHDLHHQHHLQLGPPPSEPLPHHLHHLQQVATHHPHLHHHSASTNLLHGPPPLHHHHLHPHYTLHLSQPQQQQQPQTRMATGLPMETDDKEANNLLPADSKSLLTELILTTQASMESRNGPSLPDDSTRVASSKSISSSTTTTTISSSGTNQHQPRDSSSSDNSLSLSDSLAIPSADADTDAIASRSISIDGAKVQSRDGDDTTQLRETVDPPSPVPIPASTVKRRPLLVACKKATPKQSPPNSYKNLIKRTNGTDDGEDLRAAKECIEAVELSDEEAEEEEEEEEVDEEEEEEEEEEDEDGEDEEAEEEEEEEEDDEEEDDEEGVGVEDVEDVELEEQRKVLAEQQRQRGAAKGASHNGGGSKVGSKKRTGTKLLTDGGRRKGLDCARKLLTTTTTTTTTTAFVAPRDRHRRQALSSVQKKLLLPPPAAPRRPRKFSVKHVRRVFRTSIESLKRLPPALQGRLLGRSNVTLVRRTIRKRTLQSPETTSARPSPTLASCDVPQQNSNIAEEFEDPKSPSAGGGMDHVASATIDENQSKQTEPEGCPIVLLDQQQAPVEPHTGLDAISEVTASEPLPVSHPIPMTIPLSNVDRTIDLVARGYFSEPEILTRSTELKLHSRAWLKRLKQQQQQEGRSHSEQSRGAAGSKSGCPAAKKGNKKASPLADVVASALEDRPAVVAEKKTKCRAKSSKNVPAPEGESVPCSIENSEPKGKKKSSSKEHKKESSKKKKQKVQNDGGQDSEGRGRKRAKVNKPNASRPATVAPIEETVAMYQRATSTPIPPSNGLVTGDDTIVVRQAEEDHPKGGSILDESGVTPMDQSSVIDDRETDFDDAATMLVEDDVASVDTSVLVNRHNNNNNSAVTDKNNPSDEQCTIGEQVTLDAPLQAVIAEGKEGSELEPPEGMEPFMDEEQEEELEQDQSKQQVQAMRPHDVQLLPPPVLVQEYAPRVMAPAAKHPLPTYDDEELEDQKPGSSRSVKRRRSRSKSKSKKFSKRKRHRPSHRGATAEPAELIVPRKRASSPRWSNGWTWEGQPFQGKVFLNSDDPPILRTCYPAMRHVQGDIVRPRDCVLLKAGSKRAELPYVAKVAHLWENLEDGEMMMSLLWYYRPEHTEQGRQQTDGPDEVFASRHKDHNSVACIEDKCYVLTFSEYCRFRRQLKGLEENIEEQPSIVPPLRRENPRLPPAIVSPELVMYCQRVYEFRQKRLLKSTS
uniref:BAH domain-containing protein n=1 Tax=Anopheles atroparvus TaxID=41427 RepID=A0AAG5CR88_ANOAO